jgi:hypothetical protein
MTIEPSEGVDRMKTWGCGFVVALAAAGALAAAFWPRGEGGAGRDDEVRMRIETVERRLDALERK